MSGKKGVKTRMLELDVSHVTRTTLQCATTCFAHRLQIRHSHQRRKHIFTAATQHHTACCDILGRHRPEHDVHPSPMPSLAVYLWSSRPRGLFIYSYCALWCCTMWWIIKKLLTICFIYPMRLFSYCLFVIFFLTMLVGLLSYLSHIIIGV